MIPYQFRKNIEEYANRIVLASAFRKPSVDYWTEDSGGAALWGTSDANCTNSVTHVVGSHSLLGEPTDNVNDAYIWYPSAEDAAWDITKCGSEKTIPHLGFYFRKNSSVTFCHLRAFTTDHANDYFNLSGFDALMGGNDVFEYFTFPLGPYYALLDENRRYRYTEVGAPDWADINGICFMFNSATQQSDIYIDDLHLSGKIIREASDTSELAGNDEYQRVILNDTAVDDTLKASDDSGLAGRLIYAELLRRAQTPIVGMITIPMAPTLLPGQTVHIYACQQSSGAYRIDKDFRVKELRHVIGPNARYGGFETQLNLTDDVTNTHAFGVPTAQSLLFQYVGALGHAEARDLKGSGIDHTISRLSKAYA